MASEHFSAHVNLLEKAGGAQSSRGRKIRPLNSVICLLGAQRYKNLGEVVKKFVYLCI